MSKIINTKCDVCGTVYSPTEMPHKNFRVAVEERTWVKNRMNWVPIDICFNCLRLLVDKAKEVKNEQSN